MTSNGEGNFKGVSSQASKNQPKYLSLATSPVQPQTPTDLFGMLNEAGTNIRRVPELSADGHNFTFQHARYSLSGAQLTQALASSQAGNFQNSILNHPQLPPLYRPNFFGGAMNFSNQLTSQNGPIPVRFQYPTSPPTFSSPAMIAENFSKISTQQLMGEGGKPMQFLMSQTWPHSQNSLAFSPVWSANQMHSEHKNNSSSSSSSKTMMENSFEKKGSLSKRVISAPSAQSPRKSVSAVDTDEANKKKRRKRDPTLPKPARFAWNFYFRDQYTKIRNSEPSEHNNVQKAFTEIGFDLGKKWKSLSKDEKDPYLKLAAQDKERYEREMKSRFSSRNSEDTNSDEDDLEKVGVVIVDFVVDDKRDESEKHLEPTEGELVADVLVVDDDEVFLKILTHRLVVGKKNPPSIVAVKSPEEAKKLIIDENKKFGTVLLDKDFGEGQEDGITSLNLIRESGYEGLIVGVTGSEDKETHSQFTSSGANESMYKGRTDFYQALNAFLSVHSTNATEHAQKEG